MEFFKGFIPARFPDLSILHEKTRKPRHFLQNNENGGCFTVHCQFLKLHRKGKLTRAQFYTSDARDKFHDGFKAVHSLTRACELFGQSFNLTFLQLERLSKLFR